MLKTPDATFSQQQSTQRQQGQTKRFKGNPSKNNGSSISLLKATSKVLAFLNRKSQSSNNSLDHESQLEPLSEPGLFLPQTNRASQRREPVHGSSHESHHVEKYKHIFQNRPINNIHSTSANNHSNTSMTSNDNNSYEIYTHEKTANDCNAHFESNTQHYVTPETSFPDGINQQGNMCPAAISSTLLSEQETAGDDNGKALVVEYEEQDRLLAKEQLRIVRRNLRTCSPQSLYFRRFAALADDWRNFLPQTRVHHDRNEDRYYDARSSSDFEIDSDDECSMSDPSSDSDDGDETDDEELSSVSSGLPPIGQHDMYRQAKEITQSPNKSYLQHDLQASKQSCLASSVSSSRPLHHADGTLNHGSRREAGSTSVTFQVGDQEQSSGIKSVRKNDHTSLQDESDFYDALFFSDIPALGSTSHISLVASISASSAQHADDSDANDVDADEDDNHRGGSRLISSGPPARSSATSGEARRPKTWLKAKPSRTTRHGSDKMIVAERRAHELARRSIQQQRLAKATARSRAPPSPVEATAMYDTTAATSSATTTTTATNTDTPTPSITTDEYKQTSKAQKRVRSHEIRRLGVSAFATSATRNRHSRKRNLHQPQILPPPARFWEIRIEDIVRGIETQFMLGSEDGGADVDEYGNDHGSVDSLTSLVSPCEDSDADGEEEKKGKGREETTHETEAVVEMAPLPSMSQASPMGSTVSTLCEAASSESNSVGGLVAAATATATPVEDYQRLEEQPPQYLDHELDQVIFILPPAVDHELMSEMKQKLDPDTMPLIDLKQTSEDHTVEEEAASLSQSNNINMQMGGSQVRPSLTLQTLTHTMGAGIAPGALSAIENKTRPLGSQHSLTKCNSTSSLYIDSTMAKSDVDETLRAVATVLYDKVLQSHRMNDCRTERIINSSSYMPSERVMMTQADIFDFMRFIFDCGQNLGPENAIITLIYVERITELGNLSFHAINWRRLLLGALILSIKVWEDLAVFNSDVCAIFEGLAVKDVNALERFSMAKLQYNVSVKRSLYAAYYFRLRDVSEQEYNQHYGRLTLSMSQRDMQRGQSGMASSHASTSSSTMARNDSNCSAGHSRRSGSQAGLMGMGMAMAMGMVGHSRGGSNIPHSTNSASTHHSKVPVGPGYRKWTLKPLSVREADRLEARSSVYCSNMMMEKQERKDVGCCWDEYSPSYASGLTTPAEELYNLSASLLASASSMHTIASLNSTLTSGSVASHHHHHPHHHHPHQGSSSSSSAGAMLSKSTSASSNVTKVSASVLDLVGQEDGNLKGESSSSNSGAGGAGESDDKAVHTTDPPRRVLRLKKSRSDFFYQNSTPASIM